MGLMTFAINVTLDGCYDHREGIADDDLLDFFTKLVGGAGGMLYGRITYELMESAWPQVARDEKAPRAMREWAQTIAAMPKYVLSSTRREFSWENTVHVEGELRDVVTRLKNETPKGLLVSGPALAASVAKLGLIDEYRMVVHPVLAGHGPTLFEGVPRAHLELVSTERLKSGVMAMHYRTRSRA